MKEVFTLNQVRIIILIITIYNLAWASTMLYGQYFGPVNLRFLSAELFIALMLIAGVISILLCPLYFGKVSSSILQATLVINLFIGILQLFIAGIILVFAWSLKNSDWTFGFQLSNFCLP